MGILIGLSGVGHEWPGKRVLDDATIGIYEGDRIGIVGRNGDGKSTLLDIIGCVTRPDRGSVTWRGNITVGILGQADKLDDSESVGRAIVGETPAFEWAADARIRGILEELVGDLDWNGFVGELSGGQRRRVDLARVLVGSFDVLLMDEPTNHLDLHAIRWLANHLRQRWPKGEGALLVVTHDRWFLDEVSESMWEVHDRRIEPFEGGYSAYIQQRVERERLAAKAEERRQSILRKELKWLARAAKARTSKPRFREEAAFALIANDPPLRNPLELKRAAMTRLGKQVIEMEGVSFGYDKGATVIDSIDWIVGPGERIGILGENGQGKSTLLKLMSGRLSPSAGTVRIGASVRFGWMSQHLDVLSSRESWRVQEVLSRYKRGYLVDGKMVSSTQLLERLGFDQRELMTFVCDLSGGQRRRLALLCVLMDEPNVLLLDEPGNDLDTDMLAVMEDLLDTWPGTLLLVTHDRYLMERVTDDQYALIDGHIRHVPGGVDEYLGLLDERAPIPLHLPTGQASVLGRDSMQEQELVVPAREGLSNAERRVLKKRLDAVTRRLEKAQAEPQRLRAAMTQVPESDYQALMDAQAACEAAEAELATLEEEWLEISLRLGL